MKNKLNQAVEAADVPQVRAILIDIIRKDSGKAVPIDSVTEAIEKTPGLFEKDDGKYYAASPSDMTETLIESLESDLENNFSLDKFRLFTEVYAIKAENPRFFSDRDKSRGDSDSSATTAPYDAESGSEGDGLDNTASEVIIDEVMISEPEPDCLVESHALSGNNAFAVPITDSIGKSRKASIGRKIGFVVMIAGLAAAITGLCVPVRLMIGLGIGVFMLGSALVYAAISRNREVY